jgi:hypothetical protein
MTDTSEYASTRLRAWAHSRALYVDYHARLDWVIETVTVRREAERLLARVRPGVALLWALALEIDECGATLTGERVCRACSGRQSIVATANGRYPSTAVIRYGDGRLGPWSQLRAVSVQPCSCDGPTRPDTVSLHWLVRHLASQRSPIVTDWPEQWAVDVDAMEANGWGDTWLPSQGEQPKPPPSVRVGGIEIPTIDTRLHLRDGTPAGWSRKHDPTPAWMCVWWREFREWVTTGREPDAGELARLLEERTAARRASTLLGQRFVDEVMAYDPRTDDIVDALTAEYARSHSDTTRLDGWISVAGRRLRDLVESERASVEPNDYGSMVRFSVWAGGQDDEFLRAAERASLNTGRPVDVHVQVRALVHHGPHVFHNREINYDNGDGYIATYTLQGFRGAARVADPDPGA